MACGFIAFASVESFEERHTTLSPEEASDIPGDFKELLKPVRLPEGKWRTGVWNDNCPNLHDVVLNPKCWVKDVRGIIQTPLYFIKRSGDSSRGCEITGSFSWDAYLHHCKRCSEECFSSRAAIATPLFFQDRFVASIGAAAEEAPEAASDEAPEALSSHTWRRELRFQRQKRSCPGQPRPCLGTGGNDAALRRRAASAPPALQHASGSSAHRESSGGGDTAPPPQHMRAETKSALKAKGMQRPETPPAATTWPRETAVAVKHEPRLPASPPSQHLRACLKGASRYNKISPRSVTPPAATPWPPETASAVKREHIQLACQPPQHLLAKRMTTDRAPASATLVCREDVPVSAPKRSHDGRPNPVRARARMQCGLSQACAQAEQLRPNMSLVSLILEGAMIQQFLPSMKLGSLILELAMGPQLQPGSRLGRPQLRLAAIALLVCSSQ